MEPASPAIRGVGALLISLGVAFLLHSFARFVIEGIGTPAPNAPTERLVVGGVYRHVRNPMYLAVGYAALFGVLVLSFVRFYEEPALHERFGASYDAYRAAVPGWVPRLHPWHGER
jgi:protein-S-isoprenylcysteine O-methyltransferase Ste14